MQPCTFDGALIFPERLSYTLNWFMFQSMYLPCTKAPETRTFSAVYSCLCFCFLRRRIAAYSIMSTCASLFFKFPPFFGTEACDTIYIIYRLYFTYRVYFSFAYLEMIERSGHTRLILVSSFRIFKF